MDLVGTTTDLDKCLERQDVTEVISRIIDAKTKSRILGRVLKLEPHVVEGIHAQYSDPEECLFHIIDEFVKQVDPVPTWRVILTALRHRTIRLNRLADQIEGKQDDNCFYSTKSSSYWWSRIFMNYSVKNLGWLILITLLIPLIASLLYLNLDCYQVGLCYSKSLPSVNTFVGREEDIHNITGYLDFTTSEVQVVHIVGPPGFGKSTLAMKIGEILVRKWVTVHYIDMRMVDDVDDMAEKVMVRIFEEVKNKVTFSRLEKWVHNQHSKILIILDNCDEFIEHAKDEFLDSISDLIASSRKNVRYIITSQKWVADIDNFRLHAIYNLSSEAAIELLSRVAPSLTDDQKIEIADLTGNVPLALKIVGAIFRFPDAPSVSMVVKGLKEHLVSTLSPDELHKDKVSVSIGIAYSYLTPELKQLCVNLSHIPGSFSYDSSSFMFEFHPKLLSELVRRSLLQTSHGRQRYHFHPLIKDYCLSQDVWPSSIQKEFDVKFQEYFTFVLVELYEQYTNEKKLTKLDEEKQNIQHMFHLLSDTKDVNITFQTVAITRQLLHENILHHRFSQSEIEIISLTILEALDSFISDKEDQIVATYIHVAVFAAMQRWPVNNSSAIEILMRTRKKVNKGYRAGHVTASIFTEFFTLLATYLDSTGDYMKSKKCHSHILKTVHRKLRHCKSNCDYYDISTAYNNIQDEEQTFYYRKRAYKYQLNNLDPVKKAVLLLSLYYEYTNRGARNNASKMLQMIIDEVYPDLIDTKQHGYPDYVYFYTVDLLRNQSLEERAIELENRMIEYKNSCDCSRSLREKKKYNDFAHNYLNKDEAASLMTNCAFLCAAYFSELAEEASRENCYTVAIWAGRKSYELYEQLGDSYTFLKVEMLVTLGKLYHSLGSNYSEDLIHVLELVNDAVKYNYFSWNLRYMKIDIYMNTPHLVFHSPLVFLRYFMMISDILLVMAIIEFLCFPFIIWSNSNNIMIIFIYGRKYVETALVEQKYSYLWSVIIKRSDWYHWYDYLQQWREPAVLLLFLILVIIYYFVFFKFILFIVPKLSCKKGCARISIILVLLFLFLSILIDLL